jgi:hypothetical protein
MEYTGETGLIPKREAKPKSGNLLDFCLPVSAERCRADDQRRQGPTVGMAGGGERRSALVVIACVRG